MIKIISHIIIILHLTVEALESLPNIIINFKLYASFFQNKAQIKKESDL